MYWVRRVSVTRRVWRLFGTDSSETLQPFPTNLENLNWKRQFYLTTSVAFILVQGVPLRIEIGPRDLKANQVVIVRRDNGDKVSMRWIGENCTQVSSLVNARRNVNLIILVTRKNCQELVRKCTCMKIELEFGILVCVEKIKLENTEKNRRSKDGNQQQTQLTFSLKIPRGTLKNTVFYWEIRFLATITLNGPQIYWKSDFLPKG